MASAIVCLASSSEVPIYGKQREKLFEEAEKLIATIAGITVHTRLKAGPTLLVVGDEQAIEALEPVFDTYKEELDAVVMIRDRQDHNGTED